MVAAMTTKIPDPAQLAARLAARAAQDASARDLSHSVAEGGQKLGLRIARNGTWFYHGSPIARKSLIRLFSAVLHRDDAGIFWLITPAERGVIEVEDAPFTAVELTVEGSGPGQILRFRTNVDDDVVVDEAHPIRVAFSPERGEPRPYVLVRERLEALIVRSVYYQLVDAGEEHECAGSRLYGVWSCGTFFPLGQAVTP
jgi:hypothetical protein